MPAILDPIVQSNAAVFLKENDDLIKRIAARLRAYSARRKETHATPGLTQVAAEWNAGFKSGEIKDERNRQGLAQTYAWLTALAAPDQDHRRKLTGFLTRLYESKQPALKPKDEQLGELE